MLQLLGKPVADGVFERIKLKMQQHKIRPHLAVILVGHDPASEVYVSHKQKACEDLGFFSTLSKLSAEISENEVIEKIKQLNANSDVHGILVQLPLPKHLNTTKIINAISPDKDADGLTQISLGRLVSGQQVVASCTPAGIMQMLNHYGIDVSGRPALVIGRSQIVGIPLFHLLNQKNATVTLAHSKTANIKALVKNFDLVFVAIGQSQYFSASDFKAGAVVIDVGIHRSPLGLTGDVNPEGSENLTALTPVPKGVGPMTIAMLMQNTLDLAISQR